MNRVFFVVPGSLDTPTGGYAYDRNVIADLRRRGWQVDVIDVGEGFPFPSAHVRAEAETALAQLPDGVPVVVDGLALGVLPDAAAKLASRQPLIALVHHPLALEAGLTTQQAGRLRASEHAALTHAHHVIANSATTACTLADDFEVPLERIAIAHPGTARAPLNPPRQRSYVQLLAVGALVRRKGYDVLLAAAATVRDLDWHLTITGERRDLNTAMEIEARIAALALSDRVRLVGAVSTDALAELYADADVFVLASRFEGYGMAYAEALSHGVPVIGTTGGAIAEVVPPDAGILAPPDDAAAFAAAMRTILGDARQRARFAAGARAAAGQLPTWEQAGQVFADVLGAAA